jgi:hypothetical protein
VRDPRTVALSGETYLRLLEVDLDDPEDILRFANSYDVLGVYDPLAEDWRAIRGNHSLWEEWQPELRARRTGIGEITLERLRVANERAPKWLLERSPFQPEEHERIVDYRFAWSHQ